MTTRSKFPDIELPKQNLVDYLFEECPNPEKPAFIDAATGRMHTFGQLKDAIDTFSRVLRQRNFKPQEIALIYSSNNIDYPVACLGIARAGGVFTTCNPLYKSDELLRHMKDSEPVIMFTEMAFLVTAQEAAKAYGRIRDIIVFDGAPEGCVSFEKLLQEAPPVDSAGDDVVIDIDDLCIMPYSSGTTGFPKGVRHSHRTLTAGLAILRHHSINPMSNPDDVGLCAVPLYHILGLGIYMSVSIKSRNTVVMLKRFTPDGFLQAIVDYNVTSTFIVPPIAVFLAKHPIVDNYEITSIRTIFSAAAPLAQDVMDMVKARLHFDDFRQMYGMTEVLATHCTPQENMVDGSVGILAPNIEIRIASIETDATCDVNVDGEVLIRGPQVMLGYHNNPAATAQTIGPNGWLHTGDIGHLDEHGNLFIVDRLKELIKYNAYQVAPADLEALLLRHESVRDVAVVGVPDPSAGELPRAYVVLQAGVAANDDVAAELEAYVAKHVAPQKKLRGGVRFIAEIPKSPSGKILRRVLKAQIIEEQQAKQNSD